MSDIVADIRCHLQTMAPHQRARLTAEQLRKAADEIERLREAIRRLAEQDATLTDAVDVAVKTWLADPGATRRGANNKRN